MYNKDYFIIRKIVRLAKSDYYDVNKAFDIYLKETKYANCKTNDMGCCLHDIKKNKLYQLIG